MNISPIKIMLDINVPGRSVSALTRDFFYLPELDQQQKGGENAHNGNGDTPASSSQYPFFTMDVKYPLSEIKDLGRKESIDFFFNEKKFKRKMYGLGSRASDDNDRHQNARHNVMTMLEILFPTQLPIKSNLHNSFSELIEKIPTTVQNSGIIPEFILNFISDDDGDKFSYLQLGGAKYTTIKVMWINDIINHPEYRKLLNKGATSWERWDGGNSPNETDKSKIVNDKKKNIALFEKLWKDIQRKMNDPAEGYKETIDTILSPHSRSTPSLVNISRKIHTYLLSLMDASVNDAIDIIYEIYDYDNESMKISQKSSSLLPYTINRDFKFDTLQKLSVKIKTSDDLVSFLNHPSKYYELFEEKKEDDKSHHNAHNRDLKSEIQKYTNVMEFIKLASTFIKPRRPSNPALANMIKYYLNKSSGKPKEGLAEFMNKVHTIYLGEENNVQNTLSSLSPLEVGVDEIKTTSAEKKEESKTTSHSTTYEIYVQLDVVKGILDKKSMSDVRCLFKNEFTTKMYNSLSDKKKHEAEIDKSDRIYLDIDTMKQVSKSSSANANPPAKKGGISRRKKKRFARRTIRRRK